VLDGPRASAPRGRRVRAFARCSGANGTSARTWSVPPTAEQPRWRDASKTLTASRPTATRRTPAPGPQGTPTAERLGRRELLEGLEETLTLHRLGVFPNWALVQDDQFARKRDGTGRARTARVDRGGRAIRSCGVRRRAVGRRGQFRRVKAGGSWACWPGPWREDLVVPAGRR